MIPICPCSKVSHVEVCDCKGDGEPDEMDIARDWLIERDEKEE